MASGLLVAATNESRSLIPFSWFIVRAAKSPPLQFLFKINIAAVTDPNIIPLLTNLKPKLLSCATDLVVLVEASAGAINVVLSAADELVAPVEPFNPFSPFVKRSGGRGC